MEKMKDTIYRLDTLNAIDDYFNPNHNTDELPAPLTEFLIAVGVIISLQPSAQPDYTAIKSEIITNIEEFNDAKHHVQWVQDNGKMIAFGLELALRIIEEKERRTDGEETDRKINH